MKRFGVVRTVVVLAMLVLLGTLASAQTANTSSGDRKGFIVGIGGGIGLHRIPDRGTGGSVDRTALAGGPDFKIGYAPTDQFLIHYSAKAAITQAANYDAIGVSGFGVTYLIRPTSPSFFVTAIAGEGGRSTFDGSDWREGRGFGVGAGYEFKRRWSISGDALFLRFGDNDNHTVLLGTLGYLFY